MTSSSSRRGSSGRWPPPATSPRVWRRSPTSARPGSAAPEPVEPAEILDAAALEQVYREEATRIRAALAARLGDVGLAEESVQDAFIEAIEHWRDGEVPANYGGWLATTARRKAIDRLRRARAGQQKLALLAATVTESTESTEAPDGAETADDELLGMIFACCHPAISRESQIALTLRAVCALTTAEIAAAFLVGEA